MIRMGRSSKTDDPNESNDMQDPSMTGYSSKSEYGAGSSKAMSESETMARDIKEGRLNGFVGHGTVVTGETFFNSMLRVDGHITGKVVSEDGTIIVGSTGQVDADVAVAGAVINGTVNGDIVATGKIELGRTARVTGNIQAPRLIVDDGAVLEGHCGMVQAQEAQKLVAELEVQEQESNQYEIREVSEEVEELTAYQDSVEIDDGYEESEEPDDGEYEMSEVADDDEFEASDDDDLEESAGAIAI